MINLVLRKHGYLTTQTHLDEFVAKGRPAFIICTLTTDKHTDKNGAEFHNIFAREYDVSNYRDKKKRSK